jgi:methyl-accepting chemotaxis protein
MNVLLVSTDETRGKRLTAALAKQNAQFEVEQESNQAATQRHIESTASIDCLVYVHREGDSVDFEQLLRACREHHPQAGVVLVGGTKAHDTAQMAFEHGVTDFIPDGSGDGWLSMLGTRVEQASGGSRDFVEETQKTLETLNEVTQELIEADTTQEVAVVVNEYANDVLGFPATSVRRYNPDIHALEVIQTGEQVGDTGDRPPYPVDDSPHGEAFLRGNPVVDDLRGVDDDPFDREVFTQCMYVPIGEYGTISIGITEGTFTDLDQKFAEMLANNARGAFDEASHNEQLTTTLVDIEEFAERVVGASEALADAAEEVRRANRKVVESADDIATGVSEQKTLFEEVDDEMATLRSTVETVTDSADDVASQSRHSVSLAQDGHERARDGIESMDRIENQVQDLVGEIDTLGSDVRSVAEIVDVIEDIAQQTNMLALNASIEAARADAEREGFTVVADEIKQLATETTESTDEIRAVVEQITEQTEAVEDAMEEVREDIADGAATVEQTRETLEQLQESVEKTDDGVQQISNRIDRQASTVEGAVDMVDSAATISRDTAEQADTVANLASDQAEPVGEVAERASELGTLSGELQALSQDLSEDETSARTDPQSVSSD